MHCTAVPVPATTINPGMEKFVPLELLPFQGHGHHAPSHVFHAHTLGEKIDAGSPEPPKVGSEGISLAHFLGRQAPVLLQSVLAQDGHVGEFEQLSRGTGICNRCRDSRRTDVGCVVDVRHVKIYQIFVLRGGECGRGIGLTTAAVVAGAGAGAGDCRRRVGGCQTHHCAVVHRSRDVRRM